MTAKATTDASAAVTTGNDSVSDDVSQISGQPTGLRINDFDYAGGMRSLIESAKLGSDPSVNSFLPDSSFDPKSLTQLAQLETQNPNSATDLIALAQSAERRPGSTDAIDPKIQAKIDELQTRYNITITPPGEFLGNQDNLCAVQGKERPADNPNAPSAIRSRVPTMNELEQLDKALLATGDAALTQDGKPLKVTFTTKPSETAGKRGGEKAFYLPPSENNGVAEIRINPITKAFESLVPHILRHEIGHNAENNAYPNSQHPDAVIDKIGFKRVPNPFKDADPKIPATTDAVRVNENGKEMLFIKMPPDCQNPKGGWLRVNEKGQILSERGNIVPMRNGEPDPNSRIQPYFQNGTFIERNLAVKGPTKYFDNANEAITDSFATWTGLSGEARTAWEQKFPHHFEAVRAMLEAQKRNLGR